jgi:septal ring factor EnvC (AmiA/AmiB activator)
MMNPEKSLEEKIKSVRKQIIALDSKREVLEALLEKLKNQRAKLTGEQYYEQGEHTGNSDADNKNNDYSSLSQLSPVEGRGRIQFMWPSCK